MTKQKNPLVSIVIVHYKTPQILAKNLEQLQKLNDQTSFEIIVVNNDQTSFTKLKKIAAQTQTPSHPVKLIQAKKNLGFGAGNNLGVKKAVGKFIFFLNPDTEVQNKTIDHLSKFLQQNPTVGIVAPTLIQSNQKVFKNQGAQKLTPLSAIMSHSFLHTLWPQNPIAKKHLLSDQDLTQNKELGAVPGSAFMIRAQLFKKINGFDENFFLYFEEHDLGLRTTQAGFKLYRLAQPKVTHYWEQSTQAVNKIKVKNKSLTIPQIYAQSRFYYFKKNFGLGKALLTESILRFSIWHLFLLILMGIYSALMLSIINWGIPAENQIFTYQMDEWHQLMSLKNIVAHGSPNVAGSAHGPLWHFLLSGAYLFFFYKLGVVNPFLVDSALEQLPAQQQIFQLLRLNTLLFGLGTIWVLFLIIKKQFKQRPSWGLIFFIFTPLWLSLSNYFKYDLGLIFWLTLTLYQIFNYARQPNLKNFVWASVLAALTLATKISALPIIPLLIISFFLYQKKFRQNYRILGWGLSVFLFTFVLVGIPDFWLGSGDYSEYFSSNLVSNPATSSNFNLGSSYQLFLLTTQVPLVFGPSFSLLSLFSLSYLLLKLQKQTLSQSQKKDLLLIFSGLGLFALSLIPLKIYATGNRLLVLLPFLALMINYSLNLLRPQLKSKKIILFQLGLFILCGWQLITSLTWVKIKLSPDPREVASVWMEQNLPPKTKIGLESPPIYQRLPNTALQEYYQAQTGAETLFSYQLISSSETELPEVVILTNQTISDHQFTHPQKEIIAKLKADNYQLVAQFQPQLFEKYQTEKIFNFLWTNLVPTSMINIYQRSPNAN